MEDTRQETATADTGQTVPLYPPRQGSAPPDAPLFGLSAAVDTHGFEKDADYMIADRSGRVLCVEGAAAPLWTQGWTYVGLPQSYGHDMVTVSFSENPFEGQATPKVWALAGERYLFAEYNKAGAMPQSVWTFAGPKENEAKGYPLLGLRASPVMPNEPAVIFSYADGKGDVGYLTSGKGTAWAWLVLSKEGAYNAAEFLFHKIHLKRGDIFSLLNAYWPTVTFNAKNVWFMEQDGLSRYTLVPDELAKQLWDQSGLAALPPLKTKALDCDDYAFIYRAQAARSLYETKRANPYALGVISGVTADNKIAHAANVYINYWGDLMILEPQTGVSVPGTAWQIDGQPVTPYRVVW